MKIAIASDHAGYQMKEQMKQHLTETGVEWIDCGTNNDTSCDYPVFAQKLCHEILCGNAEKGILICGTGIGMSIAANKVRGIRAALCSDCFSTKYTRLHNDSNVMCLGARVIGQGLAEELADIFLNTFFEGGKHLKRIEMFE